MMNVRIHSPRYRRSAAGLLVLACLLLVAGCDRGSDAERADNVVEAPVAAADEIPVADAAAPPVVAEPPAAEPEPPAEPPAAEIAALAEPEPPAEPPAAGIAPASEPEPAEPAGRPRDVAQAAPESPAGPAGEAGPPAPLAADFPVDEALLARIETADADAGWSFAQRCAGCHSLAADPRGAAGEARVGPPLAGVVRARVGGAEGFAYSDAFVALRDAGIDWNLARLDAFLADPAGAVPGTAMSRAGIAEPADRANVIAFLVDLAERSAAAALGIAADGGEITLAARIEAADAGRGEALASARCGACHRFGETGDVFVGPNLFDVLGNPVAGGDPQFDYSPALRALNAAGEIWTLPLLDAFLESPSLAIPGTRMGFTGVADEAERAAIIAYIRLLSPEPYALGGEVGVPRPGLGPAAFTADQAELGAGYFDEFDCALCHGEDLRGRVDIGGLGDAPALAGTNFERRWYPGNVGALFDYILNRKSLPVSVNDQQAAALVAYILRRNGFRAGQSALEPDAAVLQAIGFYQ
jgi:cytochrome c